MSYTLFELSTYFYKKCLLIQEINSLKMIGRAELHNGLYHVQADNEDSLVCFFNITVNPLIILITWIFGIVD